jgi:hypothetical protein
MIRELAQTFLDAAAARGHVESAKAVLANTHASMLELYVAARHLISEEFYTWEPETLWLTLPDLAPPNRDKLLAAIAIVTQPTFFTDFRVFGHTCEVASHDTPDLGAVPRPSVAAMTWTVLEAHFLYGLDGTDHAAFDEDVISFVAGSLATAGFAVAPPYLDFAAEDLAKLCTPEGRGVAEAYRDMIAAKKSGRTPNTPAAIKNAVDVQEVRLDEVNLYVEARARSAVEGLRTLTA